MLDQPHLQAFVSIAKLGSFSVAADHLHLTQPAISKRISTLENYLDTRLFDRVGRGVQLTEAGRILLTHAQRILLEMDDSRRSIKNLSEQVSGYLDLATSHHIGLHRLPTALRHYTRAHNNVVLNLRFLDSEQACRAVLQGDIELAIVTLPITSHPQLLFRELWKDPLSIVISEAFPYIGQLKLDLTQGKKISIQQQQLEILCQYEALLPAMGTFTRTLIEQAFERINLRITTKMPTNYLETLKMMVSVGLGWSVLPLSMIGDELIRLHSESLQLKRTLGVVWHSQRTLSNAAQAMIDLLG